MPLLERQIIASVNVSQTETFITRNFLFYSTFATVNAPQIAKIQIPPNVIRSSIQIEISKGGGGGSEPTQLDDAFIGLLHFVPRIGIHTGIRVPSIFGFGTSGGRWESWLTFNLLTVDEAIKKWGNPPWKHPNVTLEDIAEQRSGNTLFFSVIPPMVMVPSRWTSFKIISFASITWKPYDINITVTGYVTSEFQQDTGISEDLVSASIEDLQSKGLYGDRFSSSELQSDFIETQVQAIRVGEALLWNRNKVIEARFLTLFNPSVKRGSTIRVLNINNDIIFHGVVKTVGHLFDIGAGDAVTEIIATTTEYVFQSFLGESQPDEKLDERQ